MNSRTRFELDIPVACPPNLFLGLYTEQLRKRLASLLALRPEDIRVSNHGKDKYSCWFTQGALSGVQVAVRKKFSPHNELRAIVTINPYSKTEHALMVAGTVGWSILLIPAFLLLLPVVRWVILSFILAVIMLAPFAAVLQALIRLAMRSVYSAFGNE